VKEAVKKKQLKEWTKTQKRNNDGRTEKNGAGCVVRSGTARLSGTWDE
jgi:hypothetical protein